MCTVNQYTDNENLLKCFTFSNACAAQGGGLNELQIAFVCKETLSVSSQV